MNGEAAASIVAETAARWRSWTFSPCRAMYWSSRRGTSRISALDAATGAEVFALTIEGGEGGQGRASRRMGWNLLQANERAGQQDVFHFHLHVMARYTGDRDRVHLGWHPHLPARAELDALAERIKRQMTDGGVD